MATQNDVVTVDADGHVLEPRDTWQKYLEPELRDIAIRIEQDDEGASNLARRDVHSSISGSIFGAYLKDIPPMRRSSETAG